MKRHYVLITLLSLLSFMAVSCHKGGGDDEPSSNEVAFRVTPSTFTKGSELSGNVLPNTFGIYTAGTLKYVSGEIAKASFFTNVEQEFSTSEEDPFYAPDMRTWHSKPVSYWPQGVFRMDFLSYAERKDLHISPVNSAGSVDAGGEWVACWEKRSTAAASSLSFNGVDTYRYQNDVMFGVKNSQGSPESAGAAKVVSMVFNHTQALLIFNVRNNFANADSAADYGLIVDDISFLSSGVIEKVIDGDGRIDLSTVSDTDVLLKTVGSFAVMNIGNNVKSGWSFGSSATRKSSCLMPDYSGSVSVSRANCSSSGFRFAELGKRYGEALDYVPDNAYAQLGETLLIPEQDKIGFTIRYHFKGKPSRFFHYVVTDNEPWVMGQKYIYNIDFTPNQVIVTENPDKLMSLSDLPNIVLVNVPSTIGIGSSYDLDWLTSDGEPVFSSSDESVVVVDPLKGTLTGIHAGKALITARALNSEYHFSVTVSD